MERLTRMSVVDEVEQWLERALAEGRLHIGGGLPSERVFAKRLGVSRSTVREAFQRLELRGVFGARRGRRARVAGIDDLLSLELVGVLLGKERATWPERRRFLEGFLERKRLTAVELFERMGAGVSGRRLDSVLAACFDLRESARWSEEAGPVVEAEFALLRATAEAVDSPGHLLLVNSLKRGLDGLAPLLQPALPLPLVRRWADRVLSLLGEASPACIRTELLPQLLSVDAYVLEQVYGPAPRADGSEGAPDESAAPVDEVSSGPPE